MKIVGKLTNVIKFNLKKDIKGEYRGTVHRTCNAK